jgi:hypothetical protein
LSTKTLKEADAANELLQSDVDNWQQQAHALTEDAAWQSVDLKFPPQLDASKQQLLGVWEAFKGALLQAKAAKDDANQPLPSVPVWAEELRVARSGQASPAQQAESNEGRAVQAEVALLPTRKRPIKLTPSLPKRQRSATPKWIRLSARPCVKLPIRS